MPLRSIAFWLGAFSLVVGLLSYDKEVATASVPVVSGAIVMILALAGLIPEFKVCCSCGRKIPRRAVSCRFCRVAQPDTPSSG